MYRQTFGIKEVLSVLNLKMEMRLRCIPGIPAQGYMLFPLKLLPRRYAYAARHQMGQTGILIFCMPYHYIIAPDILYKRVGFTSAHDPAVAEILSQLHHHAIGRSQYFFAVAIIAGRLADIAAAAFPRSVQNDEIVGVPLRIYLP